MADPQRIIATAGQALTLAERVLALFGGGRRRKSSAQRAADLRAQASAKRLSAARARFPGARARRLKAAAALDAEADRLDLRPV